MDAGASPLISVASFIMQMPPRRLDREAPVYWSGEDAVRIFEIVYAGFLDEFSGHYRTLDHGATVVSLAEAGLLCPIRPVEWAQLCYGPGLEICQETPRWPRAQEILSLKHNVDFMAAIEFFPGASFAPGRSMEKAGCMDVYGEDGEDFISIKTGAWPSQVPLPGVFSAEVATVEAVRLCTFSGYGIDVKQLYMSTRRPPTYVPGEHEVDVVGGHLAERGRGAFRASSVDDG